MALGSTVRLVLLRTARVLRVRRSLPDVLPRLLCTPAVLQRVLQRSGLLLLPACTARSCSDRTSLAVTSAHRPRPHTQDKPMTQNRRTVTFGDEPDLLRAVLVSTIWPTAIFMFDPAARMNMAFGQRNSPARTNDMLARWQWHKPLGGEGWGGGDFGNRKKLSDAREQQSASRLSSFFAPPPTGFPFASSFTVPEVAAKVRSCCPPDP